MSDEKPQIIIDMVADPICPWCYVGKRALDRVLMALSFSHVPVVRYRPFQLSPEIPAEGIDYQSRIEKKFPDPAERQQILDALLEAARTVGLRLDPTLPKLVPNSLNALRALRWSHYQGLHTELIEGLFAAYWHEGADIGDPKIIAEIAGVVGIEDMDIVKRLKSDEDIKDIQSEIEAFRHGGVSAVPTYIVNESLGFAGALEPDQLLKSIRELADETPANG